MNVVTECLKDPRLSGSPCFQTQDKSNRFSLLSSTELVFDGGTLRQDSVEEWYSATRKLDCLSLLVQCISEDVLKASQNAKFIWSLCYQGICRTNVPIILIVIGSSSEFKNTTGEQWWDKNREWLRENKIHPHGVGYIKRGASRHQREKSRNEILLFVEKLHVSPWKVTKVDWAYKIAPGGTNSRNAGQGVLHRSTARILSEKCGMTEQETRELSQRLFELDNSELEGKRK